ncbi:MAG TPA: efflux RND transporter permease subunit, partial [Thermogutta sp.]|nr:efflux RND transporter permease subunit [Thermogutta sp.]
QTQAVADKVQQYFLEKESEGVVSCMTIVGSGFSGRAQNNSMVYVMLKDWHLRERKDLRAKAIADRATAALSSIREASIYVFPPPPIRELGNATGFDFELIDMGGIGHDALMAARNQLLEMAAQHPVLQRVRPNGMEDVAQYRVDIDWERAGILGVPITSIHNTISAAFGGSYVNDFIQGGRVKRVYVQADAPYRMLPEDLQRLYVRNQEGKMVPFDSFATTRWTSGSPRLERFNGFPAVNIWGEPAPGHSSGEAMRAMEELVGKLPPGVGFDWRGISYQERMATTQAPILYAFSILVIFLCVAALYESWTIPFVNLLMLPLGVFGALTATYLRGLPNDVYFQIGFLTTMGLSTKNAILIIQFVRDQLHQGRPLVEATLTAARIRFRPVIMTSLAFFFGTLPLAVATGAGAGAMNAIGTAVTGGMVSATFIDLIFIPMFFVLISQLFGRKRFHASESVKREGGETAADPTSGP